MKLYDYSSKPRPTETLFFDAQLTISRSGRHFEIISWDDPVGPGKIDVIALIHHAPSHRSGYPGYYLIRPEGWRRMKLAHNRNEFFYALEPSMGRYRVRVDDLTEAKELVTKMMSRHPTLKSVVHLLQLARGIS